MAKVKIKKTGQQLLAEMRAVAAGGKVTIVKCTTCKGTGYCHGLFSDYDVWKCKDCEGTGVVWLPVKQ